MKVLDDIWDSIKGNVKTRITDPIIGAFVLSWSILNWDKLAILFFGIGEFEARVIKLSDKMSFTDDPDLILQNLELWFFPILLTLFYVFLWPIISGWVALKINPTELKRHNYIIDSDIKKSIKQKNLNKARLRANPKNKFLEQEIEIDLAIEKSNAEIIEQENIAAKEKAEEAKASNEREIQERNNAASIAEEAKAKEDKAKLELQKKERTENHEKIMLKISIAEHKAILASHRFPSAYLFLSEISESISMDDVVMSMDGLSRCVATIFGYDDFEKLLDDKSFSNENFKQLKYVICDPSYLTEEFTEILEEENIEDYDSQWLIEHVDAVFEKLPYDFIYEKPLAEKIHEQIDINSFDLLNDESLSGTMADTDTQFDEVFVEPTDTYGIDGTDGSFFVELTGSASGNYRKDADIKGQGIVFGLMAKCPVLIGRFGFGEFELNVINSSVEDYD
ncbi:MAG: hypothetical protein QM504_17010 [Pseudomonadota bacterium]